jgi:hypothetical protein
MGKRGGAERKGEMIGTFDSKFRQCLGHPVQFGLVGVTNLNRDTHLIRYDRDFTGRDL